MQSEDVETGQKFDASKIKGVKVIFTPDSELKKNHCRQQGMDDEYHRLDLFGKSLLKKVISLFRVLQGYQKIE